MRVITSTSFCVLGVNWPVQRSYTEKRWGCDPAAFWDDPAGNLEGPARPPAFKQVQNGHKTHPSLHVHFWFVIIFVVCVHLLVNILSSECVSYHLHGLCEDDAIQADEVLVAQWMHGVHLSDEIIQTVWVQHACLQALHSHWQLEKTEKERRPTELTAVIKTDAKPSGWGWFEI